MQINELHEDPAILASKGHTRVAITHATRIPAAMVADATTPPERRRAKRENLKAARRAIERGGSILPYLTTTNRGQYTHGELKTVGYSE